MNRKLHKKIPLPWIIFVLMVLLLPALAYLQYGWLGQISMWEKERMKMNLDVSLERFSEDFDREISKFYSVFSLRLSKDADVELALKNIFEKISKGILNPVAINAVYYVSRGETGIKECMKFQDGSLSPSVLPNDLAGLLATPLSGNERDRFFSAPMTGASPPSIVVPVTRLHTQIEGERHALVEQRSTENIVVTFDQDVLLNTLIKPLKEKYFSRENSPEYKLTITDSKQNAKIYDSDLDVSLSGEPDASTNFFSLRMQNLFFIKIDRIDSDQEGVFTAQGDSGELVWSGERETEAIEEQKSLHFEDKSVDVVMSQTNPGIWRADVTHVAGSLEKAVAVNRQRNMLLSLGILIILALGMLMLAVVTSRARGLAQQRLEFVAGVTHELRTPLAVIRSAGQNLADSIVTDADRIRHYGVTIEQEAERLSGMVENVLLYARMSAVQSLKNEQVSVHAVINKVFRDLESEMRLKGITLRNGVIDSEVIVSGDSIAIESIIRNLLLNASQYGADIVRIEVDTAENPGRPANEVRIAVIDNGPGIKPHEQKSIFKPFYRGENVRSGDDSNIRGSGIGLTLAQRLAKAMGGDIALQSSPGKGSTFTLVLPESGKQNG